jgi:septal ring factor EnvC (AmiA/AmiB activator)
MKEKHNVYVDTDKFNRAREGGINISALLESALDKISQDESFEFTLQLDYLETQMKEREQKLEAIEKERTLVNKQLETVKSEYRRISKQQKMEEKAISMSQLLASLNRVIRACDYEIACIKKSAEDILTQIYRIDRHFNLEEHIRIVEDTSMRG